MVGDPIVQKGQKNYMSGNLLIGAGYVDIKGTGTSHTSSFQRILLPPTLPAIGPFHFPPGLAHLHNHQPPRGPALSTPLLSRVHREDDAYFTMDTNSPNTLCLFFFEIIEKREEWEKDRLWLPEQVKKLPYASVSSSQNRNNNGTHPTPPSHSSMR